MRGATEAFQLLSLAYLISIHAPHAGRDAFALWASVQSRYFNPRAPCGARRWALSCFHISFDISIHAPHAGRDTAPATFLAFLMPFQSTRPMRGATTTVTKTRTTTTFQSTRPMRGATEGTPNPSHNSHISIHAPHAGRDPAEVYCTFSYTISIHAPHAGRDSRRRRCWRQGRHFNPRAPCGARPVHFLSMVAGRDFNPRAPCGARLGILGNYDPVIVISIHAPHAGRDCS